MPRLSDSMEEGTIINWLVADGELVERDQPLVEIETDKATMVYEAPLAGRLRVLAAADAVVAVGEPIARIDADGESAPPPAAPADGAARGALSASPLARRVAAARGVDLATVAGSGPNGRIRKADVEAAASSEAPSPAEPDVAVAPKATQLVEVDPVLQPLSRVQQVVARRMSESASTVPDFSVETVVDMGRAVQMREQLQSTTEQAPSLNDFVIAAAGRALRRHPRLNGRYSDGAFEARPEVNVGLAVAGEGSLLVPVVRNADTRSLGSIAALALTLAERARGGHITAPELAGGTFTVSNLGMFDVDSFSSIVNPGQAAILSVGRVARRPHVADGGELTVAPTACLRLTCDHRVVYGVDAARFLAELKSFLEEPLRALV